jgi:uncharacterized membrane protein HdeD (DUF308 family)
MSAAMPSNVTAGFPSLAKKIWIFAIIRGVLGIIFGLVALFAPIATALVLAIVIGIYAIVEASSTSSRRSGIEARHRHRWRSVSCSAPSASCSGSSFLSGRA